MDRGCLAAWASLVALGVLTASMALGQTYSNTTPLWIPLTPDGVTLDTRASLYPSTIQVTGGPTSIGGMVVKLNGVTHGLPEDYSLLLVSPSGRKIHLMKGVGGNFAVSNLTLWISKAAAIALPFQSELVQGTYRPAAYGDIEALPAPAPGLPYSTDLSTLSGTNANGNWSLYVWNIWGSGPKDAIIERGWSLSFTTPIRTAFTYQGVVKKDGQPVTGAANVRFSLMTSTESGGVALASPVVRSFSSLEKGLFSTELDFGDAVLGDQELWLQMEVEAPPGSGFVTLAPRTRVGIVPQAGRAMQATRADFATTAQTVPWSGVSGVPAFVTSPAKGFALNKRHGAQNVAGAAATVMADSGMTIDSPGGIALVNWSLSAFTNFGGSIYSFKFRVGGMASDPVVFCFNLANLHQTVSGCAMINLPPGLLTAEIVTERIGGVGTLNYDFNDSVGYTIMILH